MDLSHLYTSTAINAERYFLEVLKSKKFSRAVSDLIKAHFAEYRKRPRAQQQKIVALELAVWAHGTREQIRIPARHNKRQR
jgi:hypothetical protein